MKAGQGDSRLPAWEDEAMTHYLWRLCHFLNIKVGEEPPLRYPELGVRRRDPGQEG